MSQRRFICAERTTKCPYCGAKLESRYISNTGVSIIDLDGLPSDATQENVKYKYCSGKMHQFHAFLVFKGESYDYYSDKKNPSESKWVPSTNKYIFS